MSHRTCPSNLVLAGLYMPGSGLTSVLTHLASYFSARMSVSLLVFDPCDHSARDTNLFAIPTRFAPLNAGYMRAENDWLRAVMQMEGPTTFLITGPANMARSLLEQLSPLRPQLRVIYYLPTEGEIIAKEILDIIDFVDACVLYTEGPLKNIKNLYTAHSRTSMTSLHVIGHGVNASFFDNGLRTQIHARHKMRQSFWHTEDANEFVVLNVNRPYLRKRLDISIEGFALFAERFPSSRLVLHPGRLGARKQEELEGLINSSGAAGNITVLSGDVLLCEKQLNNLYNVSDVGMTTSMGEGWGLTTFEHAITGAPQIVPDHTSFSENWRGSACMLPTLETYPVFYEYSQMHITTPVFVAEALEKLYSNCTFRKVMGSAAKSRASKDASWEYVGQQFLELITHPFQDSSALHASQNN